RRQPLLNLSARKFAAAIEADDEAIAPVQLNEAAAARFLMQVVDVLGDQKIDLAHRLELRERAMRVVRPGRRKSRPSTKTAGPVEAPDLCAAHEFSVVDRLVTRPRSARAAVVGNARFRAAAGAGENDESAGAGEKVEKQVGTHHEVRGSRFAV